MRLLLAVWMGKLYMHLARAFHMGGGTSFPGILARKIEPATLRKLSLRLKQGAVMVTGTNGKTTTNKMLNNILKQVGISPIYNISGANLPGGVTTAFLDHATLMGRPKSDLALLEIDEAAMPRVAADVVPRVVIVTNFFRDQLDRYGELDHTVALIRSALATLPASSTVLLNADDPLVSSLGKDLAAQVIYFGLEDARQEAGEKFQTADAKFCTNCGAEYSYSAVYYGHLGKYRCPRCGNARPDPQIYASSIEIEGMQRSRIHVVTPQKQFSLTLNLPALYNVYNALVAVGAALSLGIEVEAIRKGIESVSSAFGRMEKISIEGKEVVMALVKNPTGFNEVLHTLLSDKQPKKLMILINDNPADGEDVSWLWDVDFEMLAEPGIVESTVVSGIRAGDMAVRLKYAGADVGRLRIDGDFKSAFRSALAGVNPGETLYVLPTYTAMLDLRKFIHKMGYVKNFWEE